MRNKGAGYLVHFAGIGLSVVLMAQGGCGIKSDPKPTERIIPARVTDLSVEVKGTEILIKWSVPGKKYQWKPPC